MEPMNHFCFLHSDNLHFSKLRIIVKETDDLFICIDIIHPMKIEKERCSQYDNTIKKESLQ